MTPDPERPRNNEVYGSDDEYSQPAYNVRTDKPPGDTWEFVGENPCRALYKIARNGQVEEGSIEMSSELQRSVSRLWSYGQCGQREWENRERRIDAVATSVEWLVKAALRNFVAEVKALGGACPEAPRSLAELIILAGHGYNLDVWEHLAMLDQAEKEMAERAAARASQARKRRKGEQGAYNREVSPQSSELYTSESYGE